MSLKNTFGAIACEWHQSRADRWSLHYRDGIIDTFEKNIFPYIDKCPVVKIRPMEPLEALRKMEKCGALERMRKVRQRCGEVSRYAIVIGRADYSPAPDLVSALTTSKEVHSPLLTTNKLSRFLDDLAGYIGSIITRIATQIITLTGIRMQELCFTRWEDIDFETKLWEIPAEVMKMKRPHIVLLSEQVIALFKQLEPISKHHPLIFIGRNDPREPISKESVNQVIESLGYRGGLTGYSSRHTMNAILREKGLDSVRIETQLAHADKNAIRGTYNHAQYLNGRREMM